MWCLAVYLPMLIDVCIPKNDEHWTLYCMLLEIVRIIFSPLIGRDQATYLQVQMQCHHQCHYMIHMPRIILEKVHFGQYLGVQLVKELWVITPALCEITKTNYFVLWCRLGPLVRSWCMRYYAKHHYFKRLATTIGNFINIPYTLAKRHQEGLCHRLQSCQGEMRSLIEKGVETGPGTIKYCTSICHSQQILTKLFKTFLHSLYCPCTCYTE